jgi:hypothetical protein
MQNVKKSQINKQVTLNRRRRNQGGKKAFKEAGKHNLELYWIFLVASWKEKKVLLVGGLGPQLLEDRQAFLLVLGLAHPEVVPVFHYVRQDGAADEDHVFAPRRIFNPGVDLMKPFRPKFTDKT